MNINMSVIKTTLMASATTRMLLIVALVILSVAFVVLLIRLVHILRRKPNRRLEPAIQQVAIAVSDGVAVAPAEPEEEPLIVADDEPTSSAKEQSFDDQPVFDEELDFSPLINDEPVPEELYAEKETESAEPTVLFADGASEEDGADDEFFKVGSMRYNRSYLAKYIQSSDETKDYYVHLKNELLSYKNVRSRTSWKREAFKLGKEPMAKFIFRGKTLCLCLPLDPTLLEKRYHVEDVSGMALYDGTPCMYRINNERRLKQAYELIELVAAKMGTTKTYRHAEDYYMPYQGTMQLIDKGLIRRVIRYNFKDIAPKEDE